MNGQVVYGQALFDAGRHAEAEGTFTTALTLDPENLIVLRHLGDIARLGGNVGGALDWYKRVLDADPRNEEILAFIEELKSALAVAAPAAATAPAPEAAPEPARAAVTPTPIAPIAAVPSSAARTVEIAAPVASRATTPTPLVAVEPVPPPRRSEPKRRASLMDLDLDLAGTALSAADAPVPPPPSAPAAPVGDIELGSLDMGTPAPAAAEAHADVPALEMPAMDMPGEGMPAVQAPDTGTPAAEAAAMDTSLGWEMGGNVELPPSDGSASDDAAGGAPETPQVFVTETMAELYLQQGFRDEALQVYRQLADQNPHDASIRERIHTLEGGGRSSMSFEKLAEETPELAPGTESLIVMPGAEVAPAAEAGPAADAADTVPIESLEPDVAPPDAHEEAPAAPPAVQAEAEPTPVVASAPFPVAAKSERGASARSYFAALAQRRALRPDGTLPTGMPAIPSPETAAPAVQGGGSVDSLFGAAPSSADDAMGQALATAVGLIDAGSAPHGRPTQAAASELSLDSVFRSDSAFRTSGPVKRQSEVLKFDQFFASGQEPAPAADAPDPDAPAPVAPTDDAQFQSWLRGLKKP